MQFIFNSKGTNHQSKTSNKLAKILFANLNRQGRGEATSKGYFVPADRDPDLIQRIKNGDLSTEVEIL